MNVYSMSFFDGNLKKSSVSFLALICFSLLISSSPYTIAQSLTDPALNFTIFVKEDLTLIGTEVEGRVAVGGNLILPNKNYQIIPKTNDGFKVGGIPIGLAVRGGVDLGTGSLKIDQGNYLKIGNPSSPKQLEAHYVESKFRVTKAGNTNGEIFINHSLSNFGVSATNNPIFENVFGTQPGQIDIDGAFEKFRVTSNALKDLPHNVLMKDFDNASKQFTGPFRSKNGLPSKPKFILDPTKINVLTITNEVWNSFQNDVRFEGFSQNPGFALIINIENAAGDVRFASLPDLANNKGHVVINFPGAESDIKLKGNGQIDGVILAPQAKVIKDNPANFVGQIIARSFVHNDHEIHYQPLKTDWYERAILVTASTRCFKDAPYLDYQITANFDVAGLKATIEWLAPDGTVVETLENQPLTNSLLFPGAEVDHEGVGIAWPGWTIVDGKWTTINDEKSKLRLAGSKIRVSINPVFLADFSYPQSTEECFTDPPPSKTPLPVRLISFKASEQEGRSASLTWSVEDAKDFSHFEVEKSVNGSSSFSKIGEVVYLDGTGSYSFNDSGLSNGISYYRLRLVDIDGTVAFSNIVSLTRSSQASFAYGYPNPFVNKLTIVSEYDQVVVVFDATGRQIANFNVKPGNNEVDTQGWPFGLALIRGEKESRVIKVMKK